MRVNNKHTCVQFLPTGFTRMALSVWATVMLSLYTKVQVNILGRHLYIDTARSFGSSNLMVRTAVFFHLMVIRCDAVFLFLFGVMSFSWLLNISACICIFISVLSVFLFIIVQISIWYRKNLQY